MSINIIEIIAPYKNYYNKKYVEDLENLKRRKLSLETELAKVNRLMAGLEVNTQKGAYRLYLNRIANSNNGVDNVIDFNEFSGYLK